MENLAHPANRSQVKRIDDLDQYIARLKQSGHVDSEGCFTVAGDRAVGKLSKFLLESSGDWILKLVQAACASGAQELGIRQTRLSTQAQYHCPYLIDLTLLEQCLVDPMAKLQSRGLHHLITGLRALQASEGRTWVARIASGEQQTLLQCVDRQVSARRLLLPTPVEGAEISLAATYPGDEFGKLGGVRFGASIQEEHSALLARVRACPIPLYLDGRRIDDLREPPLTALQTRLFLAVTYSNGDENGLVVPHVVRSKFGVQKRGDPLTSHTPFYLGRVPLQQKSRSIIRWYFNYTVTGDATPKRTEVQKVPAGSRVVLIRDGVVVGSRGLGIQHPISVDILMNADHLKSDLSGLKVDPSLDEVNLAKLELKSSKSDLREIGEALGQHTPGPSTSSLLLYGGLGAVGLLLPVLGAKLVVGGLSALKLRHSAQKRKYLADFAKKATYEFEEYLWPPLPSQSAQDRIL